MKEVSALIAFDLGERVSGRDVEGYVRVLLSLSPIPLKYVLIPEEIEIQKGPRIREEGISSSEDTLTVCTREGCNAHIAIGKDGATAACTNGHPFLDFKPMRLG